MSEMPEGNKLIPTADKFLLCVLAVSLLLNVGLFILWHQGHLRPASTVRFTHTIALPRAGMQVTKLDVLTMDGAKQSIDLQNNQTPTVVYILAPTCGWCMANRPNIIYLANQKPGYRFIGISTTATGLKTSLQVNPLPFPVYVLDPAVKMPFDVGTTPETLVFSQTGGFLKGWMGAYIDGENKAGVSQYFSVKLPDTKLPTAQHAAF